MKEFNNSINKKIYYTTMSLISVVMLLGLFAANPLRGELSIGYIMHFLSVVTLIVVFFLYPKIETYVMRVIILLGLFIYFYTIFLTYPGTWSTFFLLCLIPAISIFFFDTKLFFSALIGNGIMISITFGYIAFIDQGVRYPYFTIDIIGNYFNFIASQLIIFAIYYLSYVRMKKMEVYYEQIQQTERLRATGQLAAAVAHEIRNPLTVVKGFLQLYEKDTPTNKDSKKHFRLMIDELNTAEQVISQFLSIAKPNVNTETETVNVKEALIDVRDILQSYGILHNNQIQLHLEDNCFIEVNKIEFKQLLINIIKNAIEVSEIGDPVIIKVYRQNNDIEINITDFGMGMSEEEVQALGTPFYSLKSKGTGLGLMVCFNIVEKYDGTLTFQSSKGEGTTVLIRFPAIQK